MKCTIPEISWHNREPVLSVDIHPISNDLYKLASGGGDSHILIWNLCLCENGSVKQEVVSDLTRHQRSVNIVRWSSSGRYLASADDDANIIVWQLKTDNIPLLEGNNDDKEIWIVYKVLRGHKEDIYDLCWSVDDKKLLSGSIDNTSIIWDLDKGKMDHIMTDHKGFVQGVAWDPKNQILATISTDRVCRIFDIMGKQIKARINKGKLPLPANHDLYDKESKFFHDDTFKSFFRRLQFTPDGSLLVVPSGYIQVDDSKCPLHCTLIFTLDNWTEPAAVLPLDNQSSTTVRCCPLLFQLREEGPKALVDLPYRMIFAVGTDHDIVLYDTQQIKPFARFHQIHYTRITDLTWSSNGLLLVASSTDGFCTLITFEVEELGKVYVKDEEEVEEEEEKDENVDISNEKEEEKVKKRPSFIQQWVQNIPKKTKIEIVEIDDKGNLNEEIKEEINKLIPRRITPIRVDNKDKFKDAKLIEVRRKPRDEKIDKSELVVLVETNKELEKKMVENETKTICTKTPTTVKPKLKKNPLLEFLQRSKEKKKPISEIIDLTMEEEAARDGFDKESIIENGSKDNKGSLDEDCTEDFCLQLEDTSDKKDEVIEIKQNKVDVVTEKKPRRVPFITLTSPKGKKKPVAENNRVE